MCPSEEELSSVQCAQYTADRDGALQATVLAIACLSLSNLRVAKGTNPPPTPPTLTEEWPLNLERATECNCSAHRYRRHPQANRDRRCFRVQHKKRRAVEHISVLEAVAGRSQSSAQRFLSQLSCAARPGRRRGCSLHRPLPFTEEIRECA